MHGISTLTLALQAFYEDVFEEMDVHGKIECLNVCDNYSDHLVGNVYVKFKDENAALNAMTALQNRYYNGKQVRAAVLCSDACSLQFQPAPHSLSGC